MKFIRSICTFILSLVIFLFLGTASTGDLSIINTVNNNSEYINSDYDWSSADWGSSKCFLNMGNASNTTYKYEDPDSRRSIDSLSTNSPNRQ